LSASKNVARKGNNNQQSRLVSIPRPSFPGEVLVRLRLGFDDALAATASQGLVITVNPGLLDQWSALSTVFANWRQVAWQATITPDTIPSGSSMYAAVEFDYSNSTLPPVPSGLSIVTSVPGSKVRALNSNNSVSVTHYAWRTRDMDALLFVTTSSTVELLNTTGFLFYAQSAAAWSATLTGWIDVEFKSLVGI